MSVTRTPKGGWTIRVRPFPQQTLPPGTPKATAHALELDLKLRKKLGENYQPTDITLEHAIKDFLRLRLSQGAIRPRSVEALEREAKAWKPFYGHKLGMLRRPELEDFIYDRAAYHRRSAKNELEFLKRVLKLARDRGHSFADNLLGIPPIQHKPRVGQAARKDVVLEIVSWMPEHSRRIPLLAFETGRRATGRFTSTKPRPPRLRSSCGSGRSRRLCSRTLMGRSRGTVSRSRRNTSGRGGVRGTRISTSTSCAIPPCLIWGRLGCGWSMWRRRWGGHPARWPL
jgi:hypothetical protein